MKNGRKKSAFPCLALCLFLSAASPVVNAKRRTEAPPPPPLPDIASTEWVLQVPDNEPVSVTGVASFDGVGSGPGAMMYPAPNAVGFLAAIVTHGIVQGAQKRKQHDKVQEAANQVLQPYQPTLSGLRNRDVALAALTRMPFGDHKTLASEPQPHSGAWRISASPHFSLTQDQRAFIVDNAITLHAPGVDAPSYQTSVRVISQPRDGEDLTSMWIANEGAELKKEWGYLFAESVDVALRALSSKTGDGPTLPFATMRYAEGGTEKIERAQPLYETCGRVVMKTLRGALMSVPAKGTRTTTGETTACPNP